MVEPMPFRPRTLAMQVLESAKNWEAALVLPLPKKPGFDLLKRTRDDVLNSLDWLMADLEQGTRALPDVQREIMRAAGRLAEIGGYWPQAYSRHIDESLAAEGDEGGWGWLTP